LIFFFGLINQSSPARGEGIDYQCSVKSKDALCFFETIEQSLILKGKYCRVSVGEFTHGVRPGNGERKGKNRSTPAQGCKSS
jgi:hypothetical protein